MTGVKPASTGAKVTAGRKRCARGLSPLLLIALVWGGVFLARQTPFIEFPPLRDDVIGVLVLAYVAFAGSYCFALALGRRPLPEIGTLPEKSQRNVLTSRLILAFALLGTAGAIVRGYDFLFLRGLDYSQGIASARLDNMTLVDSTGAGARPWTALARILTGFSTVAMVVALLRYESLSRLIKLIAASSFGLMLVLSVLEGGRNPMVVNAAFLACAGLVRVRSGQKAFPVGPVARKMIQVCLMLMLAYVLYVFADRFAVMGYDDGTLVPSIERTHSVKLAEWIKELPEGSLKSQCVSIAMLQIYVTHGVDHTGEVIDWTREAGLGYGRYNFHLPTLALQRLGLPIPALDFDSMPSPGLYRTALGEFITDFGVAGTLLLLAATGFLSGVAWRRLHRRLRLTEGLFISFVLCALIASPLFSILPGFFGIAAGMLVFLMAGALPRRKQRAPQAVDHGRAV